MTRNDQSAFAWALLGIAALTAIRLHVVGSTDLGLGPDEAQYWWWSKDLAFGYFSKPPVIAWIIAGTTAVCGDGEACVRVAAPFIYAIAALFVFGAARLLYDARTALWSSLIFATLPGVSLSSALITTDVPLLMFWAIALFFLARMLPRRPHEARLDAIMLGIALGLAIMSKYAGAYFIAGLIVAALFDRRVRAHAFGLNGIGVLAVAGLIVLPNVIWNLQNGFATVGHTASNAGLGGEHWNIDALMEFAGAQFGVFGPLLLGAVIAGLIPGLRRTRWPNAERNDLVLLSLAAPVMIAGLSIAFFSRANANWAAPAFVSLSILAVVWLLRGTWTRWLLWASAAFALVAAAGLYAAALHPPFIAAIGQTSAFKLLRGWEVQGPAIANAARSNAFGTIIADDREDIASLLYYTRDSGLNLRAWTPDAAHPIDHFQMTMPYRGEPHAVLFVTRRDDPADVLKHFAKAELIEVSSVSIAENRKRTFRIYALEGYRSE
jgi:4-amino-4-deoxy-L-arabinose transferase-like glycosyltransferase